MYVVLYVIYIIIAINNLKSKWLSMESLKLYEKEKYMLNNKFPNKTRKFEDFSYFVSKIFSLPKSY